MKILSYLFEGPFWNATQLQDSPGVYVVLSSNGAQYRVVDVGESATVRSRVESHDRQECWTLHATGPISYAAYYSQGAWDKPREEIEKEIRRAFSPPCGVF